MVLWEITLGTAYFLGLKRTYKLALKIQRRLVGPKRPKIRQLLQRKTRSIFDMALKVHREVQQRDIEVGRNLGNWILRWLDKWKPGAQIRAGKPNKLDNNNVNLVKPEEKQLTNDTCHRKPPQNYGTSSYTRNKDQDSGKRYFSSGKTWHEAGLTVGMMMRPKNSVGFNTIHYRRFDSFELKNKRFGVIRNDIMQWLMQK